MNSISLAKVGRQRLNRWLDRRAPRARSHILQRDNLYIFLTRTGFVFCGLIAVLWMLGTNYQNNVILGLCLLLTGLFVLTILRTHNNLAGVELRFHDAEPGFAGSEVAFHLDVINRSRRAKDGVRVSWREGTPQTLAVEAGERARVSTTIPAAKRGYLHPGRLRVETVYPLGLLRCWSWLKMDAVAVVYPEPVKHAVLSEQIVEGQDEAPRRATGTDEFDGFREYQPGDPLKHIAWKQFAREQGLLSKEFDSPLGSRSWLSWQAAPHLDQEERLSNLCYWALHYDELGTSYGLDIPGARIAPGTGAAHRRQVLTALALYSITDPAQQGATTRG